MSLKKWPFIVICLAILFAILWSTSQKSNQQEKQLTLILNSENTPDVLPRNFRASRDPWKRSVSPEVQPSRDGLDTLNASGSGEFSENGLKALLARLHLTQPLIVVDLREESHGFANGIAVSWYAIHDTGNVGKTLAQIEADESERLQQLLKQREVTIEHVLSKPQDIIEKSQAIQVIVENVATEKELTQKFLLGYVRIPVTDHLPPTPEIVQRFLAFIDTLPPNTWLHFHCEAGDGRTTSFLSLYDMIRNGKKVSFHDIIQRQYLLGGINLLEMPSTNSWKYPHAVDRKNFLENFYESKVAKATASQNAAN